MSISHSIKELFTIKDKNIEMNSFQEIIYKNKKATLSLPSMREIFYCSYVSCRSFMFYFETSSLHNIRRVDRA
ncbi:MULTISPECIES: hypothetical protein, partial [unclassified Enterococcus]|uniref:hypothetical protein n=1 Tax=unclassified Enterococcus TaxID=2608891 RepID=UPI001981C50A